MPTRICTVTLGDRHDLAVRTHGALLTALAHAPPGTELCLVTDQPGRYAWLAQRVRLVEVDAATLRHWRGTHDFFWRTKVEAIRAAAALGPAHLIYVDSDVLIRQPLAGPIQALADGAVYMHLHEHDLATARRSGDRRLWRMLAGRIPAPCPMWNAGVVAVGEENLGLLEQVLDLVDELLAAGAKHSLTEQLAFSHVLASTGRIQAASAWCDHYWCNKPAFDHALEARLSEYRYRSWSLEAAAADLRDRPIVLPLVVRKRWWNKLAARWA